MTEAVDRDRRQPARKRSENGGHTLLTKCRKTRKGAGQRDSERKPTKRKGSEREYR